MGTRGIMGFRQNGADKVMYNHWDSEPQSLGYRIVEWTKGKTDDELTTIANNIFLVRQNATVEPRLAKWARENGFVNLEVGNQRRKKRTACSATCKGIPMPEIWRWTARSI